MTQVPWFISNAWLIPVVPVAAFVAIVLFTRRFRRVSAGLSILAIAVSSVLSTGLFLDLVRLAPEDRTISISFTWMELTSWEAKVGVLVDPLSVNMLLVVCLISLLVQVYSLGYMHGDERFSVYFSYLSLFTASMLGLTLSNNYLQIFICWEWVGLCSYLLIGFWYFKPEAADACKKAFVVNRIGDMGFLMGVITIGIFFSTFDFLKVQEIISGGLANHTYSGLFIAGIALLLFGGAVGKSAQFPLHVWLPDAMEGPTPVSALIHAATMVAAGVYMVARTFLLFTADPLSMTVVAFVGGFTALLAATIAVAQNDIKRVLAYSTVSQLGYMIMALGAGGYTSGMFHLTTHACFKALLFLAAGSVIHALHTNDIWKMGGVLRKMRITGITFLIAVLAISGVPPFSGFWSKDAIFETLRTSTVPGHEWLFYSALFTAFLTAFYMFRLFFIVFIGEARDPKSHERAQESPWVMTIPLLVLAVFSIGVGWINWPGVEAYSRFVHYGEHHGETMNWLVTTASVIVVLLGFTFAAMFYWWKTLSAEKAAQSFRPLYLLLKNKYYVDEAYGWLVKRVYFGFAAACHWFDEKVVDDGMVDGTGWLARQTGRLLNFTQTGSVQNYALVIFAAVAVIYFLISF